MGSCTNSYKNGVDYSDFPDKDVPIYDDAVVFEFEVDENEFELSYGTTDDIDDIIEFYQDEFEDEDYNIIEEVADKDEYSVEGYIDDIYFEIEVEEATRDEGDYFDYIVTIDIEFDYADESMNNTEKNAMYIETDDDSITSSQIVDYSQQEYDKYCGTYSLNILKDESGNILYSRDEIEDNWMVQTFPGFYLLETGEIADNTGAITYYGGMWSIEGNHVILGTWEYPEKFTIEDNYLVYQEDIETYLIYMEDNAKLNDIEKLYGYYEKSSLFDYCYPVGKIQSAEALEDYIYLINETSNGNFGIQDVQDRKKGLKTIVIKPDSIELTSDEETYLIKGATLSSNNGDSTMVDIFLPSGLKIYMLNPDGANTGLDYVTKGLYDFKSLSELNEGFTMNVYIEGDTILLGYEIYQP